MKIAHHNIYTILEDSKTTRSAPFIAVEYRLFYQSSESDKQFIDKVIEKAKNMAGAVNPHAANYGLSSRSDKRRLADAIAGILSETFWKHFINQKDKIVDFTPFVSSNNQIDLKVVSNNLTIEVRSSIVRNGISFAISNPQYQFDIIGPYHNEYKPDEIIKDFYLRALYHFDKPEDIVDAVVKDGFSIFLTGGATKKMMSSNEYYYTKSLSENEIIGNTEGNTDYRLIKFNKAFDTVQMRDIIIEASKLTPRK